MPIIIRYTFRGMKVLHIPLINFDRWAVLPLQVDFPFPLHYSASDAV